MTNGDKRKRKILRRFTLDEISSVDRPAQEHARMAIIKSADARLSDVPLPMNLHRGGAAFSAATARRLEPTGPRRKERTTMDDDNDLLDVANQMLDNDPGLSRQEALRAARRRNPALYKRMNDEGADDALAQKTLADVERDELRNAPEVLAFEKRVNVIQDRDKISRFEALKRACRELSPDQLERYRKAMR